MNKPVIGIIPAYDIKKEEYRLDENYVKGIELAGGIPMLIPYIDLESTIENILAMVHGIMLTGGGDIHPSYYGEEPLNIRKLVPERDSFEVKIINSAYERGIPILGICRGSQVINVALGGTLIQHIMSAQHYQDADGSALFHMVEINKGTLLYEILKREKMLVNSFHHQAIKEPAPVLKVSAKARDGIVEAVESTEPNKFVLGVQFHIELLFEKYPEFLRIFEEFVNSAKSYISILKSE